MPGDDRALRAEARANKEEETMKKDIKEIKDQLLNIIKQLKSVEKKVNDQADKIHSIGEICQECINTRQEINELKSENTQFKRKIREIELHLEQQEIKKKRNMIEIYGVAAKENENRVKIVCDLARVAKVNITKEDIEEEFRAKAIHGKDKPITVKFKSAQNRDLLIKNLKKIKPRLGDIGLEPENKMVFINEALIPTRKRLLFKVKGEARDRRWKGVWTYKGDIYIRLEENGVQVKIETEEDLITLIKE